MSSGPAIEPLASPPLATPWVPLWPLQNPQFGDEMAYAERTTDLNWTGATSEALSALVVAAPTVTLDGATPIIVEFWCSSVSPTAANDVIVILYENGVPVGRFTYMTSSAGISDALYCLRRLSPTAGTKTYQARVM